MGGGVVRRIRRVEERILFLSVGGGVGWMNQYY